MFDIGWQELFVLAILAIIVIGPKDLPRAIKTVTHWIRKARGMARELQDGLDDMVREAELDDIKKQANSIMTDELDPGATIARELDMTDEQRDWSKAVEDLKDATDPDRDLEDEIESAMQVEADVLHDPAPAAEPAGEIAGEAPAPAPAPEPEPVSEPEPATKVGG